MTRTELMKHARHILESAKPVNKTMLTKKSGTSPL